MPTLVHYGLTEGGVSFCICPRQDVTSSIDDIFRQFSCKNFFLDIFEEQMGERPYSFPDLSQGEASRGNQPSRDRWRVCLASLLTILGALETRKSEKQSSSTPELRIGQPRLPQLLPGPEGRLRIPIGFREGLERFLSYALRLSWPPCLCKRRMRSLAYVDSHLCFRKSTANKIFVTYSHRLHATCSHKCHM